MNIEKLVHNKKALTIVGIFFVVLITTLIVVFTNANKIDLSSYTVIKAEGLNTQGTASYNIDKKTLETTLIDKNINILNANIFIESINCSLDKNKDLKNGDKITAKLTYDKTLANQLKINIKNSDKIITVSGLPEGKEIDVFKDIKVSYSGISPEGNVSIINNSSDSFISKISYTPSKEKVSNGDKITITADYDTEESVKQRLLIKNESKEYTVSGLPEYIFNSKQFEDTSNEQLTAMANRSIDDYLKQLTPFFINHIENRKTSKFFTLGDKYTYKNVKPLKSYLITEKENSGLFYIDFNQNKYYRISSVDLYANGQLVGTTYINTLIFDIFIDNGKIQGKIGQSCQLNTFDDAISAIEDYNKNYNIEQITN
jgi:hypothetical protein